MFSQMNLFPDQGKIFRPIHYLGSKLRMIDHLEQIIDEVDPSKGRVYDLFSGSGTVSAYLNRNRLVTAVDIQEYSKVLTSALILPCNLEEMKNILKIDFEKSEVYRELISIFKPIIKYEKELFEEIDEKSDEKMAYYIENSSIIKKQLGYAKITEGYLEELISRSIENLKNRGWENNNKAVITRYYGGVYFSFNQAVCIDTLLEFADTFSDNLKNVFVAAILSTASEVVNTIGKHFAQPLSVYNKEHKAKNGIFKRALKDRKLNVFEVFKEKMNEIIIVKEFFLGNIENHVVRADYIYALENLDADTSVIYADPPYTRYHYSRYYHVLETISLRDTPQLTTVQKNGIETLSKGIYRADRILSDFSVISKAPKAFEELFSSISVRGIPLILSYSPQGNPASSTPRSISIEQITKISQKYFNQLEISTVRDIKHSKLNKKSTHLEVNENAEILFLMKP